MANIQIRSAFVEEQVGNPVFALKIAEPHSRKDEQGQWQTVARTFFDVKVPRDSSIDLSRFGKGSRVMVEGAQKTTVREHQGKKFYTLTVFADRVEFAEGSGNGSGGAQSSWGAPTGGGGGFGGSSAGSVPPSGDSGGFGDVPF